MAAGVAGGALTPGCVARSTMRHRHSRNCGKPSATRDGRVVAVRAAPDDVGGGGGGAAAEAMNASAQPRAVTTRPPNAPAPRSATNRWKAANVMSAVDGEGGGAVVGGGTAGGTTARAAVVVVAAGASAAASAARVGAPPAPRTCVRRASMAVA